MEKIIETTETITKKIHEFYCDECGALIGTSEEYRDGDYERCEAFELNVLTPDGLFKYYDKLLCENCKLTFPNSVYESLEALGFKHAIEG